MIHWCREGIEQKIGINIRWDKRSLFLLVIVIPYAIQFRRNKYRQFISLDEMLGRMARVFKIRLRIRPTFLVDMGNSRFIYSFTKVQFPIGKQTILRTEEQIEDERLSCQP